MKKKIMGVACAFALALSMSSVAFADVAYEDSGEATFNTIVKSYNSEGNVQVSETLSFTSAPDADNPDTTKNLTVTPLAVGEAGLTDLPITVSIPSYSKVGVYKYTISENGENTAGVAYTNSVIRVVVMVEYDNEDHKLVIGNLNAYILKVDGEKTSEFNNSFNSGSFTVAKNVQGNMANENDEFDIVVTLTAPEGKVIGTPIKVAGQTVTADEWVNGVYTTTLTLSHADDAVTFADIPVGVTVTVTEPSAIAANGNVYEYVSGAVAADSALTIADDTDSDIVILNEKTTKVDTALSLESLPFVVMLVAAGAGLAVFAVRRRQED